MVLSKDKGKSNAGKSRINKGNINLLMLVAVIVVGYVFFFTSNFTLPDYSKLVNTGVGKSLELDNRTITINRWIYSPGQQKMEIELEIDNHSFDGIDDYAYGVVFRPAANRNKVEIKRIVEESNFVVIHIDNIPKNFREISFRVAVADDKYDDIINIFNNFKDIDRTESIEEKTLMEYRIDNINGNIATLNDSITDANDKIKDLEQTISNIKDTMQKAESDKIYQTDEQIQDTNKALAEYRRQIDEYQNQIKAQNNDILEFERQIDKANEKLEALKKQNGVTDNEKS